MPEVNRPYSEATLNLVAQAMDVGATRGEQHDPSRCLSCRSHATLVLDMLAEAGLLVREGAETRTECEPSGRSDLPVGQQSNPESRGGTFKESAEDLNAAAGEVLHQETIAALQQAREDAGKLAATIAAFPDAHNAANLAHARMERDALRAELATMREVAQGNKRHVAYLTEENEQLRAEVARARAQVAEDLRRTLAALNVALYWAHPDTAEGRDEIAGCRIALEMGQAALETPRPPAESVVAALPDVVGTRRPVLVFDDAQEEADEMVAQEGTSDVEY